MFKNIHVRLLRKFSSSPKNNARVTLYEPNHKMGHYTALLLKQSPYISELKLYGKSSFDDIFMDLSHIDSDAELSQFLISDTHKAIFDTDIYVITNQKPVLEEINFGDYQKKHQNFIECALEPLLKTEHSPLIIFYVEPISETIRIAKHFLKENQSYDPTKFLVPFTHFSTLLNTLLSKRGNISADLLNCFTTEGTLAENTYPLLEPNNPELTNNEVSRKLGTTASARANMVRLHLDTFNKTGNTGPIMTYAHSLAHYVNSVCFAIDNDVVVTLNSVADVYVDDALLSYGSFKSAPLLINKNGILGENMAYKSAHPKCEKDLEVFHEEHMEFERHMLLGDKEKVF